METTKNFNKCLVISNKITIFAELNMATPMRKDGFLYRAYDLYADGFKHMNLGKTLWAIIIIKLLIIFVVLRLFFLPNFLKEHAKGDEAGYVANEIVERSHP